MKEKQKEELKQMIKMNVPILDYQHSFLIDLFYKLDSQSPEGMNVYKIFLESSNYLSSHLRCEEEYMRKIDYPYYDAHKKEHEKILDIHINILNKGINNGGLIICNKESKQIFSEFIATHFSVEDNYLAGDTALIKYVKAIKKLP